MKKTFTVFLCNILMLICIGANIPSYQNSSITLHHSYRLPMMLHLKANSGLAHEKPVLKAQRLDGDSILLQWNKIENADGYILYRATSRKGTYHKIAQKSANITRFSNHNCVAGKIYYYKMFAYQTNNQRRLYSQASDIVSKKCMPTIPKNLHYTSYGLNTITLQWNSVKDVDGYEIYCASDAQLENEKLIATTTENTIKVKHLQTNHPYSFKIRSYVIINSKKQYSDFTTPIEACTRAKATQIDSIDAYQGVLMVNFNDPHYDGYYIQVSPTANFKKTTQVHNTYVIGDLQRNQTYYVRLKTYCIINGKKIYSYWSNTFKSKTK